VGFQIIMLDILQHKIVKVVIEVPRGSFLKRGWSGKVDFVSPCPCPFNCPNRQLMAQRNRENGVTLPSVKSNFTERSVAHDKEKEKTVSRGEERFPGMGLPD
jgi:hypothetical protein